MSGRSGASGRMEVVERGVGEMLGAGRSGAKGASYRSGTIVVIDK